MGGWGGVLLELKAPMCVPSNSRSRGGATVLSLISMVARKLSLDAPEKNVCSSVLLFTTGLTFS